MRKRLQGLIPITLITAMLLTGCSSAANNTASAQSGSTSGTTTTESTTTDKSTASTTGDNSSDTAASDTTTTTTTTQTVTDTSEDAATPLTAVISSTSQIVVDPEFTSRDLDPSYDKSKVTQITLKDSSVTISGSGAVEKNGIITISSEGVYIISGKLTDGQIVVDAKDTVKIQLVLNGATIACSDFAPIYVKSANKVFITLADKTVNTLTDGSGYTQIDENTVDGVIFSKADLTLNGTGTLNITAKYKHGIVSKDDLVITGGTYNITANKNVLSGKNCIKIKDGTFTLSTTNGKALTSKNEDDTTKGYVYISGGMITVKNCYEGIEGTAIIIEGGNIDITSSDDGFNAANGASASADAGFGRGGGGMENDTNCYISVSGGTIKVNASGDGLDSNGSQYFSGGTVYVSGPTENNNGGLDYNGESVVTGGTVVVAGSAGMAQSFSDTSSQYSILNNFSSTIAGGTEITLKDSSGKVIVSFTPEKDYQSVVITSPELAKDATYNLACGSQTADLTLSSVVTSNGQAGMGFGGGMMGGRGGMKGGQGGMRKPGN